MKSKSIVNIGSYRFYRNTCSCGKSVIICIEWLRDYYLITSIETTHKTKQNGFRSTSGNDNLCIIDIDPCFLIVSNQFPAIAFVARAVAVFKNLKIKISYGIKRLLRGL